MTRVFPPIIKYDEFVTTYKKLLLEFASKKHKTLYASDLLVSNIRSASNIFDSKVDGVDVSRALGVHVICSPHLPIKLEGGDQIEGYMYTDDEKPLFILSRP